MCNFNKGLKTYEGIEILSKQSLLATSWRVKYERALTVAIINNIVSFRQFQTIKLATAPHATTILYRNYLRGQKNTVKNEDYFHSKIVNI
jgi:hypothetical protein